MSAQAPALRRPRRWSPAAGTRGRRAGAGCRPSLKHNCQAGPRPLRRPWPPRHLGQRELVVHAEAGTARPAAVCVRQLLSGHVVLFVLCGAARAPLLRLARQRARQHPRLLALLPGEAEPAEAVLPAGARPRRDVLHEGKGEGRGGRERLHAPRRFSCPHWEAALAAAPQRLHSLHPPAPQAGAPAQRRRASHPWPGTAATGGAASRCAAGPPP